MIEVLYLDRENYRDFQSVLLPAHLQKLQRLGNKMWGLGIVDDHKPVGVSLMELQESSNCVDVFYFRVKSGQYQVQLTQLLLERTGDMLSKKGFVPRELDLQIDQIDQDVLRLFITKGWGYPLQQVTTCICDMQRLVNESWVISTGSQEKWDVFPWRDVSQDELDKIADGVNLWFPPQFSPLKDHDFIDGETSFALQYQGNVVGWLICERIASNMLLCRTLFVRDTGRARVGVRPLIAQMIKVVAARNDYLMFVFEQNNHAMNNLVNKRIEKAIINRKYTLKFGKHVLS